MTLQKGVVLLPVLAIATSGMSLSAHQQASKPDTGKKQQLQQRIERVENGLLPAVVIKGETPLRMRIDERMKFATTGQSEFSNNEVSLECGDLSPLLGTGCPGVHCDKLQPKTAVTSHRFCTGVTWGLAANHRSRGEL